MIGNDIVDLAVAKKESNIFRPRFLEKICSQVEIEWILSSHYPTDAFWRIWTMKESAYKAFQRKIKFKPVFNPFAFTCQFEDSELGKVSFNDEQISIRTNQTKDFIYSEVISSKGNVHFFGSTTSFLEHLKLQFNLKLLPEFQKTKGGMPFLELYTRTLNVSKTHHGKFQVFLYNTD